MDVLLEEEYLTWLYSQVASVKLRNKSRSHWALVRQLFKKQFIWLIPNDDNRVEDGRDLRFEFLEAGGLEANPEWIAEGCSMLEMLLALARRLAFETEGEPRAWFWHLIEVLDIYQYNDRDYNEEAEQKIDDVLDRVIWRLYAPNGRGGLFPLQRPQRDQREVELWYQASAYLLELQPF